MKTPTLRVKRYKKLYAVTTVIKDIVINIITGVYFLVAMIFISLDMEGTYTVIGLAMLILLAIKKTYFRAIWSLTLQPTNLRDATPLITHNIKMLNKCTHNKKGRE